MVESDQISTVGLRPVVTVAFVLRLPVPQSEVTRSVWWDCDSKLISSPTRRSVAVVRWDCDEPQEAPRGPGKDEKSEVTRSVRWDCDPGARQSGCCSVNRSAALELTRSVRWDCERVASS